MSWSGTVLAIHIGVEPSAPMGAVRSIRAIAGRGLEGDRYLAGNAMCCEQDVPAGQSPQKALGKQITLIEMEAIEALEREVGIHLEPVQSRRNILTRGVALNHLVGQEFNVGEVRLRGVRLCEPCTHLEGMTQRGVLNGLLHRGGLRAQILTDGEIRVGDRIAAVEAARSPVCV